MAAHHQAAMLDPFTGTVVMIDWGMAPAMRTLWTLGIETTECCQGPPLYSRAIICFAGDAGAERVRRMLPDGVTRRGGWTFERADCVYQDSALMLPAEDVPVLLQCLLQVLIDTRYGGALPYVPVPGSAPAFSGPGAPSLVVSGGPS